MNKQSDLRGQAIAHEIIVEMAEELLKSDISPAAVATNTRLNPEEVKKIARKIK